MKIEEWNAIPKDEATDVKALECDICTLIDGVAFLVQRTNNFNNIICLRVAKPKQSLLKTFCEFRQWLQDNKIQYARIEGIGKHAYHILALMRRYAPETADVIKNQKLSEEAGRHILFVKTY